MSKKHRHSKPAASSGGSSAHPTAAGSRAPSTSFAKPVLLAASGALILALGLLMGMAGLRFMMSQHYSALAQRAMRQGNNLPDVESNSLKAIRFFHSNGFAHHMLGSVYRIQGRHKDALEHYTQALRTTAHPGGTYHGIGESALHGAPIPPEQGVAAFERGLHLWPRPQPEPGYVWYQAGGLAVNNGMPAKALLFMSRSQNLLKEQEFDIALARAEAWDNLGDPWTAALYLARQLVLDPNFAAASQYLLKMCQQTGLFDDCRFALETALAANPNSAGLHNTATGLEFMAGDLDRAGQHAERTMALAPDMIAPRYFLGEIHFKRGQWADAKPHYEAYLKSIGPNDPQATVIKNRLEDIDRRLAP